MGVYMDCWARWKFSRALNMLVCLLFIAALVVVGFMATYDCCKPSNFPPGPKWLPIVGSSLWFCRERLALGYNHLVWHKLAQEHGPVVGLKLGRNLVVAASGSTAVQQVLTREEFDGRPDGFLFRLRTCGKRLGIVFSDGQFWQKQRKFSLAYLRHFGLGKREMETQIVDEALDLILCLKKRSGSPIEMHDVFDISVLNVLWAMIAGHRYALDDIRLKKLMEVIHEAFRVFNMAGGLLDQMPYLRFVAPESSGYNQQISISKAIKLFLEETIGEHKKTFCSTHSRDLIDAFLERMFDSSDATFTDEQLISLCADLFMAGSETTSNSLSFAMLYMLHYPEVQRKVREELCSVVGSCVLPNLHHRNKLVYTEATLMEVQRIINVAPIGVAHRAMKSTQLMGYKVPEGAIVLTNLYSIHMDEHFWGDPYNFRPERFIDEDGKLRKFKDGHFVPFGYGRRRCLGESLAKSSLFIFFTAFLQNFQLEPCDSVLPSMKPLDGATMSPQPFRAILKPLS